MPDWTPRDIEIARKALALGRQSKNLEEFKVTFDVYISEIETAIDAEAERLQAIRLEESFQKYLEMAGGDFERLSRMFYAFTLDNCHPSTTTNMKVPATETGRPPDKWGRDQSAKLFLYVAVEEIMAQMRAAGIARPTIQDAVVRYLEIPKELRSRVSNKAKIRSYASRYSEAKKILKGLGLR